ncbi:hypothetical protein FHL15_006972 [Xylaria flabelliformis]|uniref:Acyltransferase 3 domain-containing protein n=1 Tax=Xylaria flabelliformis TaxID=2512241 RepID=A0A553HVY7_9PEZI|nr:hypothetical protein FHL15_006972 [Xylaria flabelliformis]
MNNLRRWVKGFTSSQDRHYEEALPLTSADRQSIDDDWMPRSRGNPTVRWLLFLLPFCIARPLGLTERRLPKTTSTTYLNGIRGLACWIVFNEHITMDKYRDFIFKPYGTEENGKKLEHFIQLPFVRALIAGKGMVCVFFVLSGFVLSYSSLRKINDPGRLNKEEKTGNDLLTSISSMTLRRAIRLFGPMLALAFITAFVTYYVPWGIIDHEAPNIFVHLYKFWLSAVTVMDPFHWARLRPLPSHFEQAWTLGVEYRLSLAMFLMIATTATLSTVGRKTIIIFVAAWSVYCNRRWDIACAMGGMLLAELRFASFSDDISRLFNRPLRPSKWLTTVPGVFCVIFGILLCSWPEATPDGAQPYRSLWELTPSSWRPDSNHGSPEPVGGWVWWWGTIGAFLMLWGLEQLPLLQKVLSISFLKYLGEISYAYYLLQGLGHTHVGNPIYEVLQNKYGWSKSSAFTAGYVVGNIFNILASDYFWRVIDESFIRLARFVVVEWLGVGRQSGSRSRNSPDSAVDYTPVPTAAPTANDNRFEQDNIAAEEDDIAFKEGFNDVNDVEEIRRRRHL